MRINSRVGAALILAAGLTLGGFLSGGRYQITSVDRQTVARVDRWSGTVSMCAIGSAVTDSCGWVIYEHQRANSDREQPTP